MTVITGRIASGKTTLVQVLPGLLPGDAGEICWNGKRIADPASFFVPPHSAYTAQVPRLFSASLQENILSTCWNIVKRCAGCGAGTMGMEMKG